eukprot:gene19032-13734_t
MEDVSAEIASLNAKLAEAERVGKPIEYQTALINCLTELLKEENFLLNAQTQALPSVQAVAAVTAAALEAPPQVEIAYRKYALDGDKLGLKTKVVQLMYAEFLKGSVERKPVLDATPPQFFCEILVYGKTERMLKFENSLRALFPGVPVRCFVLRHEEFIQLDEGVLAKLVKTDVAIHREDSSGGTHEFFRDQRDIERLGGDAYWWDDVSVTPSVKSRLGRVFGYKGAQGMLRDVVEEHTGVGGIQKRLIVTIGNKAPVLMMINADTSTWDFLLETTGEAVSRVDVIFGGVPVVVNDPTIVLKAKAPPVAPKASARDAVRKRTTTTAAKTKPNGAAGRRRSFSTLRASLASGDAALWGPVVSGAIGGDFRRPDTLSLSSSGGVTWTGAMDWALPVRCGSRLVDAVQRYRSDPWTSVDQTV